MRIPSTRPLRLAPARRCGVRVRLWAIPGIRCLATPCPRISRRRLLSLFGRETIVLWCEELSPAASRPTTTPGPTSRGSAGRSDGRTTGGAYGEPEGSAHRPAVAPRGRARRAGGRLVAGARDEPEGRPPSRARRPRRHHRSTRRRSRRARACAGVDDARLEPGRVRRTASGYGGDRTSPTGKAPGPRRRRPATSIAPECGRSVSGRLA